MQTPRQCPNQTPSTHMDPYPYPYPYPYPEERTLPWLDEATWAPLASRRETSVTDAQYAEVWAVAEALWPKAKEPSNASVRQVWRSSLDPFEAGTVQRALRNVAEQAPYFPTLSGLVTECSDLSRKIARASPLIRTSNGKPSSAGVIDDARRIAAERAKEVGDHASLYGLDRCDVAHRTGLCAIGPRQTAFLVANLEPGEPKPQLAADYASLDEFLLAFQEAMLATSLPSSHRGQNQRDLRE
jgi:hypothetical protein